MDLLFGQPVVAFRVVSVGPFPGLPGKNIDRGIRMQVCQFLRREAAELRLRKGATHHGQESFLRAFLCQFSDGGLIGIQRVILYPVIFVEPCFGNDGIAFRLQTFLQRDDMAAVHMAGPCTALDGPTGTGSKKRNGADRRSEGKTVLIIVQKHDPLFRQLSGKDRVLLFEFRHGTHLMTSS